MVARNTSHSASCLSLVFVACTPLVPTPAAAPAETAPVAPLAALPDERPAPPPESIASEPPAPVAPAPPAWPDDVPPLADAHVIELARISWSVGDSPPGATFIAARGELQATFRAWLDSSTARGFRVLAEHRTEHVRAASLIDGTGRRAHLLLQNDGDRELSGMFNVGRHPQTPLRGRCVAIPSRTQEFTVERHGIDQNGEGRSERLRRGRT